MERRHPDRGRIVPDCQGHSRNSCGGRDKCGEANADGGKPAAASVPVAIAQVVLIDVVFSIDSIVTAVGMAQDIRIMIAAVLIAIAIMYVASGVVAAFIAHHPTTKMLALAFLVLIGVALLADGFGIHFPRGYIYFAMAFAAVVKRG